MSEDTQEETKQPTIREKAAVLRKRLSRLFDNELNEMSRSNSEIEFTNPVRFKNSTISSMKERVIAGAFENGISKGHIIVLISNQVDDLFKIDLLTPPSNYVKEEGNVVSIVFPLEFVNLCKSPYPIREEHIIRQSIFAAIEADAKFSATGEIRGAVVPPKDGVGPISLVKIAS